ncbi:MAG: signal peptidase I [Eubacteriales bacterium]|nr:signal peptidase I [Eubacteriales bacterium]
MKKTWNIIKKVIVWMIVVFSVGMMAFTIISVTTFDRADRSVFGYSAFIVLSDSMKATDFDAGDLVIIKQTDPSTLKEGDIISFQSPDEANYGEIVTHKIREVTTDEDGNPGFVTYGTTTDSNDQGIVTYNLVIGKYKGHIPNVGTFFQFLKTVPGYFICIFTPFFILILVQARNSIKLFRKYKKEQVEEIQKEKKELEEERLKSQEMMAQLMRMQQQMGQNGGTISPELMQQYIQQQQQAQPQMQPQAAQPQPGVQQGTQQNHQPETRTYANPQASATQGVQHDANVQRMVQPQTPIQPGVQAELSNVKPQRTADPQVQMSQQSRTYAQQSQQQQTPQARPAQTPAQPQATPQYTQQAARPAQAARPTQSDVQYTQPSRHSQMPQQDMSQRYQQTRTAQNTAPRTQQARPQAAHTAQRSSFDIRSIVGDQPDDQDK